MFVDASALVALGHPRDGHHGAATGYYRDLPDEVRLVSSDYVFGETVTVLQRLAGHRTAVQKGQALRASGRFQWSKVTDDDVEEAWRLFERNKDGMGFTDCTIVAQMRRLGIESIFTFDQAFRKAGVKVVPGKG